MLPKFTSEKFRFWSLVSMILLVFVHGYNLRERTMSPWTAPDDPFTFSAFTEYFLANGLFRFRIPMLFMISGYLYALHDYTPNRERIRKRVRTLLVPYLAWSALSLVIVYALETRPLFRAWIGASHVFQIDRAGAQVLVHQYPWYAIPLRWLLDPLPYQLWFIRSLFVYNLAYPRIRRWLGGQRSRRVLLGIAGVLWLGNISFGLFEGEGLLFFSLGVLLQKTAFDIERPAPGLDPRRWGPVFIGVAALKTWLAFRGAALIGAAVHPLLLVLYKVVVAAGLITAWYGSDPLVRLCMRQRWFVGLTAFAFIIYAVHAPMVAILIDPFLALVGRRPGAQLVTFVLLPACLIVFCVGLGAVLRRVSPALYGLLTGGRGL